MRPLQPKNLGLKPLVVFYTIYLLTRTISYRERKYSIINICANPLYLLNLCAIKLFHCGVKLFTMYFTQRETSEIKKFKFNLIHLFFYFTLF